MSEDTEGGDAAAAAQPAEGQAAENKPASADSNASSDTSSASSSSSASEEEKEEYHGPKPFFVGSKLDLIAPNSGHLYLRMYDNQSDDNLGKLKVTITGTFGPPPTYAGSKESTLEKSE